MSAEPTIAPDSIKRVALAGNPNSGKSTLFNALTGLNQKIGNYPGVTVDKKTGKLTLGQHSATLIDLPGTYSLNAKSEDESVAVKVLADRTNPDHPDVVIYVADATNLKRNLLFYSQLADMGLPIILALTMLDVAQTNGTTVDVQLLSQQLGIPVVAVNGRTSSGLNDLKSAISSATAPTKVLPDDASDPKTSAILRYKKLSQLLTGVVSHTSVEKTPFSTRLDAILTHKVGGYLIFFAILLLIFQAIFAWSAAPMDLIDGGFANFSNLLRNAMPDAWYTSLLVDGVVAGLGGILIFVPQIAMLFFFVAVLEDTGYMARVSYLLDRFMRKMGLHGRSVIPLISGMACAVPAIMAARTISSRKERLATILVTPFVSCAARLPVYALLIALVIPDQYFGPFNLQGLTLMGLYLLGFATALGASVIINRFLKNDTPSFLVMEMPDYRAPRWKDIGLTIWDKVKVFVVDAGKVIMVISILLWMLASFGPGDAFDAIEADNLAQVEAGTLDADQAAVNIAAQQLEASYAGMLGHAIEPAIRPLGFDWKMGIALITSFAAREVFVGTMATIYSVGDEDDTETLKDQLRKEVHISTGKPVWTFPVGLSLMLFYAFAMQCMSTLAIVYRETNSLKWPILQLVFMTALAYLSSLVVYQALT